ncbi:DUF349 domain-containing protein [Colwelliaceae bacterium 6441]
MIFSPFRKKSPWQSKDSNTRIAAINNDLDIHQEASFAILLSLLDEDNNELVRRAVLVKLNDFPTWYKASQSNNNSKVRLYAQQEVEAIIMGQRELKLSDDAKIEFIHTKPKQSFFDAWLNVEKSPDVVIELFKRLDKPQLALTTFKNNLNAKVQAFIIEQENTLEGLEKLLKKSTEQDISNSISEKINRINAQIEKPIKLAKQTQLTLSKLLALKECSDYQTFIDKQDALQNEWQTLTQSFDCLAQEQQQLFLTKHTDIIQQLKNIFASKAEAFEQQKIANALAAEKQASHKYIENEVKKLEQCLSDSIFEDNKIDDEVFTQQVADLQKEISSSPLNSDSQQHFLREIDDIQTKLSQLPQIAQSLTDATHLISKMSQKAIPDSISQLAEQEHDFEQWLKEWQGVYQTSNGCLPLSMTNAYDEIVNSWHTALKPLRQQQNQVFHKVQRKLHDFDRLVNSGKYNASFGVFKTIQKSFEQLNEQQKYRLQRLYDAAQEKISELSDWEHYIATPRKQSLLEKVSQLVHQPLDNPNEQAKKVKEYRRLWNSLGHADDEIEQTLNKEFNNACEQAFAPCRLFYAEQDKIRAQHLVNRLAIIEKAKKFADDFDQNKANWKSTDGQLNQLKQQWHDAGEIERDKYKQINEQFNALLKPVRMAINHYYQENSLAKSNLIKQAEKLLDVDDVQSAVNDIKHLQKQWREIGYSGLKEENKLWQSFRVINDALFERRNLNQASLKDQQKKLRDHYDEAIKRIEEQAFIDLNKSALNAARLELTQLKQQAIDENISLKPIMVKIDTLLSRIEQAFIQLKSEEELQVWQDVFLSLEVSINNDITTSAHYIALPSHWQKKLSDLPLEPGQFEQRLEQTIALEILSKIDSPEEDKARRLAIQIDLLQSHMSSGNTLNLKESFIKWLNIGRLTSQDLPLLTRVKRVFINKD